MLRAIPGFKFLYDLLEKSEETTKCAQESLQLINDHLLELNPIGGIDKEIAIYKHVKLASIDFSMALKDLLDHLEDECRK